MGIYTEVYIHAFFINNLSFVKTLPVIKAIIAPHHMQIAIGVEARRRWVKTGIFLVYDKRRSKTRGCVIFQKGIGLRQKISIDYTTITFGIAIPIYSFQQSTCIGRHFKNV